MPDADITLGTDADAIHDNVSGEIVAVTEELDPVSADEILIEDASDSNNKKSAKVGNMPIGTTEYAESNGVSSTTAITFSEKISLAFSANVVYTMIYCNEVYQ